MAKRSLSFAFSTGVDCCTLIPVRPGNGIMDRLLKDGLFTPPDLSSLECVLEYGINLAEGRVFADTWDLTLFSRCDKCIDLRTERIIAMNNTQKISERIECGCKQ